MWSAHMPRNKDEMDYGGQLATSITTLQLKIQEFITYFSVHKPLLVTVSCHCGGYKEKNIVSILRDLHLSRKNYSLCITDTQLQDKTECYKWQEWYKYNMHREFKGQGVVTGYDVPAACLFPMQYPCFSVGVYALRHPLWTISSPIVCLFYRNGSPLLFLMEHLSPL